MEVREVKIKELIFFVESETFKKLDPKPITFLRAVSQAANPDANPGQTALIYVANGNELLGFAGLLPRKINREDVEVFSNTCWWVHPEKGKGLAIPLILRVIEKSGNHLYLAESTVQLKSILEKTGKFEFSEPISGMRGFMRFYLADLFKTRFPELSWLSFIFRAFDIILNTILYPIRIYFKMKFSGDKLDIEHVDKIDQETENFINENNQNDFIRKSVEAFTWFLEFPWVQVLKTENQVRYPFTHLVKRYSLEYFILKKEKEIKAFVAISHRDNLARIPYLYFEPEYETEVFKTIVSIILEKKYNSMVVFHPGFVKFLNSGKMPFYKRKNEVKFTGVTKELHPYYKKHSYIQDGDGDVVFT